jgi:hypothetical protein
MTGMPWRLAGRKDDAAAFLRGDIGGAGQTPGVTPQQGLAYYGTTILPC